MAVKVILEFGQYENEFEVRVRLFGEMVNKPMFTVAVPAHPALSTLMEYVNGNADVVGLTTTLFTV